MSGIASVEMLNEWQSMFDMETILLADVQEDMWNQLRGNSGRPQYLVIDRDLRIVHRDAGAGGEQRSREKVLELLE